MGIVTRFRLFRIKAQKEVLRRYLLNVGKVVKKKQNNRQTNFSKKSFLDVEVLYID